MPAFQTTKPCPTCDGSGLIWGLDFEAMAAARRAKGVSLAAMAKRVKIPARALMQIENGTLTTICPKILIAYVKLLPKKARG